MTDSWKRANLPRCTAQMRDVMIYLRKQEDEHGYRFTSLDDVHKRIINSLLKRDWIAPSHNKKDYQHTEYKLTNRGAKALSIYEIPSSEYDPRRYDGICPRCGERERGTYSTGRQMAYCHQCENKIKRKQYKIYNGNKNPGLCPDCGVRQKHITPSGLVRSYCLPCRRKRSKAYRQKRNRDLVKRARAGEVFLCYRCKKRPRALHKNTLQDYCEECTSKYRKQRRML